MKTNLFKPLMLTFFLCLCLLTASIPEKTRFECRNGICIRITYERPVKAMEPAEFHIFIKTYKGVHGLGVSVSGHKNVSIQDVIGQPESAKIGYQDDSSIDWTMDTKGGEEYTFTGLMLLEKPTVSYGIFSYGLIAAASHPSIARVTDSIRIYFDPDGNQMEESEVKLLMETDLPLPTLPPDVTVVPDTPFPTIIWPTDTPLPTPTPTLPSYP